NRTLHEIDQCDVRVPARGNFDRVRVWKARLESGMARGRALDSGMAVAVDGEHECGGAGEHGVLAKHRDLSRGTCGDSHSTELQPGSEFRDEHIEHARYCRDRRFDGETRARRADRFYLRARIDRKENFRAAA